MSAAALRGAEILGLTLHPHQLALGDLLDQRNETTAICWPRRAGKTEAVWCWILGMMDLNPFFNVIITAQTGSKSRERFMSHARRLDRFYPEDQGGPVIKRGAVVEMTFQNGSRMISVAPHEDSYRGDEASVLLFDEAQSFEPGHSMALKQGAMPVLDTVLDGQVILAGTPGPVRAGWFWDALEAGRAGAPLHAISEYAAPEDADPDDEDVWVATHPGIGTLTTLEKMRARRSELSAPVWSQEYLGIWPKAAFAMVVDMEKWDLGGVHETPNPPQRFGLAFDFQPKGATGALVAAWRDESGRAHLALLDHGNNVRNLTRGIYDHVVKYKTDVWFDDLGASHEAAETLKREAKVKSRLKSVPKKDIQAGQQSLVRQINNSTVTHYEQPGLTNAAQDVRWKDSPESGRYFGWSKSSGDISPIRAAAMALWAYDSGKEKAQTKITVATS